jgi:feruloyl esterase
VIEGDIKVNTHIRPGQAKARLLPASTLSAIALAALTACGGSSGGSDTVVGGGDPAKPGPGVTLLSKVSETTVEGGLTDSVYKVRVINGSDAVDSAIARVTESASGVTVVDGIVRVGALAAGAQATPDDTITLRHAGVLPQDVKLTWSIGAYAPPSAQTCADLATQVTNLDLFPANAKVTSATLEAATADVPEHCNLLGTMNERRGADSSPGKEQQYAIKWQVRLPTAWNGRFFMPGGGGLNGRIPDTTQHLSEGYAIAANDSGHDNSVNTDDMAASAGAFGTDYQARVDFAYRAIELTTRLAKGFIETYHDKSPEYSYFDGCSMGGREALMVTQRLPEHFDGVVSGDPALRFASVTAKSVYVSQIFGGLAERMNIYSMNGVPLANNTYTNQDLQLVSKAVLNACDALDGLVDGMVNEPLQCTTAVVSPQLAAVQCTAGKTASCLTADQIDTIKRFYAGPVTPTGKRPYHGWMWDPGIAGCTSGTDCNSPTSTNIAGGWRTWNLGNYQNNLATAVNTANAYTAARGGAAATVVVPTPPVMPSPVANEALTSYLINLDLDLYVTSMHGTTPEFPVSGYDLFETASTDLSKFRAKGGKLIIYQPQTGGPFSPMAMVDYYQTLNAVNGGSAIDYSNTQSFARLFMMPGAQHCGGGPSTSNIDAFASVVKWVEEGNAPDRIIGTAPSNTPWPGRTRPLCPFPQTAKYVGTGSIEDQANFVCQ